MSSPRNPLPVGLIGVGKHGERYLRHVVEDVPELRIALLSRRDATAGRRQAEDVGAVFVPDYRELVVSPAIDAVIAVVPPALHLEICRLAAGAGKAILVEKPLAVNVGVARAIVDAVRAVPCMVAHTLRFNRVISVMREHLEEIAPIAQICLSQRFEPSPLAWLDDPARSGGGMILHTGVHSFDLVRFLAGREPVRAFATTGRVATERTEDNFAAVLRFSEAPLIASIAGSRSTASRSGSIEISGERGQLVGDHHHGFAFRIEGRRRIDLAPGHEVPTVREVLRAFARSMRTGSSPAIRAEDGFAAVAIADACYRSAASGRFEEVRTSPRS